MARKSTPAIKATHRYKRRVPHKPTRVFRDRKKYDRKGKAAARRKKELAVEMTSDQSGGQVDKK